MTGEQKPVVAGHISGALTLTIDGGEPVDMGRVSLPLIVTRVSPPGAGYMTLGIGVDLDRVRRAVEKHLGRHECDPNEVDR